MHVLMGKEGLDRSMYKIRPSHEKFVVGGMGWYISSKAAVQMEPNDRNDSHFGARPLASPYRAL